MTLTPKYVEFNQIAGFLKYEDVGNMKSIIFEPGDTDCIIPLNNPVACKAEGKIPCVFVIKNEGVEIAYLKKSETKYDQYEVPEWAHLSVGQKIEVAAGTVFGFRLYTEEEIANERKRLGLDYKEPENDGPEFFFSNCGGGDLID